MKLLFTFALSLLLLPTPAHSNYFDVLSLAKLAAESSPTPEIRVKIVVADTGVNMKPDLAPYLCKDGHKDFTGTDLLDRVNHGTNVYSLIARSIDPAKHCIVVLKWYDPALPSFLYPSTLTEALEHAVAIKASYINLSGGGIDRYEPERVATEKIVAAKIHLIVAAMNSGIDLDKVGCIIYPACYLPLGSQYLHVVGALDRNGKRAKFSNYGGPVTDWRPGVDQDGGSGVMMSGTSMAAPIFTGELVARHESEKE